LGDGLDHVPILAFRSGHHDAAAATFDDYRLIAPVEEDRLRREKEFWWRSHTMARHRAVLHIAGWTRRDIERHRPSSR